MVTGPWVWYIKSTIVIMPTLSLWTPQVIIIMTTCGVPNHDKGGFQCNDTPNTWPIFSDMLVLSMTICLSDMFLHCEPFVEMLYESTLHTYHQANFTNILVNDCNILLSFRGISYFHAGMSFKATKSIGRSGRYDVSVYATGFHSRDNNVRDEM